MTCSDSRPRRRRITAPHSMARIAMRRDTAYASASAPAPAPSSDRLADLGALLRAGPSPQSTQQPAIEPPAQPVQVAYARPPVTAAPFQRKIWLQLASGSDDASLTNEF